MLSLHTEAQVLWFILQVSTSLEQVVDIACRRPTLHLHHLVPVRQVAGPALPRGYDHLFCQQGLSSPVQAELPHFPCLV